MSEALLDFTRSDRERNIDLLRFPASEAVKFLKTFTIYPYILIMPVGCIVSIYICRFEGRGVDPDIT